MDINQVVIDTCRGKQVLEIGGLGDFPRYMTDGFKTWRHAWLKAAAGKIVGVDINEKFVEEANRHGFQYHWGDIENHDTLKSFGNFEVVLLLDVIEHLNNAALALGNIRKMLTPGGKVIITTPNAFSLGNMARILTGREINEFSDHTCAFFPSHIEELFRRQAIHLEKMEYVSFLDDRAEYRMKSRLIKFLGKRLKRINTHLFIIGARN